MSPITQHSGGFLFAGRCQLAPGASAQGLSATVRYSGILHCMSNPDFSSIRVEGVVPSRLLPGATYIAPLKPVCMAFIGGTGEQTVWCVNETVLDGICPETAGQAAQAFIGSIEQVGNGLAIPSLGPFRGDSDG